MEAPTKQAIRSLALLAICGVALSGWTLYYTDWFPVVGGLLGLGGVFVWLAFLANLISDDRKKEFQEAFDSQLLQKKRRINAIVVCVIVLFVAVVPFWGTLEIETLGDDKSRIAEIHEFAENGPYDGKPDRRILLSPRSTAKFRIFTGWFQASRYYVKVDGLPGLIADIPNFSRATISVPSAFTRRPVILIRPEFKKVGVIRKASENQATRLTLEVTVDGTNSGVIEEYSGFSVWLGAEQDIKVPQRLMDKWSAEILNDRTLPQSVITNLRSVRSVAPYVQLKRGAQVIAILRDANKDIRYKGELTVPTKGTPLDYPLELIVSPSVE